MIYSVDHSDKERLQTTNNQLVIFLENVQILNLLSNQSPDVYMTCRTFLDKLPAPLTHLVIV